MKARYISLPLLLLAYRLGLVNRLQLRKAASRNRVHWLIVGSGWLGERTLLDETLYAPNLIRPTRPQPSARLFGSPKIALAFLRRMGVCSLCRAG